MTSDILRWPWDALQPCAQGTEKAQQKGFVCEEVKSKFKTKKIKFLDYVIQFEQIKKN
jgi:hypothetical protein